MTDSQQKDVTIMLRAWQDGDKQALDDLFPVIYEELRKISAAYLRNERPGHTLQTTALINEAYMKLVDQDRTVWQSRAHFLSVSAQIMRRILVNHWRERNAQKRGGDVVKVTLNEALAGFGQQGVDPENLHEALERLAEAHPRRARLVELKFFGGLSEEEMAEVLDLSISSVRRDWKLARVWLYQYFQR